MSMPDWMDGTSIAFPNLGIYLENVPKNISIFGFVIAYYGMIIGVGVLLAFMLITYTAKKDGQNPDDFYDMGLWALVIGVIGARLYYVAFSWDAYKDDLLSILNIRQGGLAIYGGVIAGIATAIIWCRIKKKDMFAMIDTGILGVLVGQILGRWGNFTNREVFGGYSDGLFAMRLPLEAVRQNDIPHRKDHRGGTPPAIQPGKRGAPQIPGEDSCRNGGAPPNATLPQLPEGERSIDAPYPRLTTRNLSQPT